MMKRIVVKNFRCFHEEQTPRMAPLTLLVGDNSTGKTSFLALTRALWDVAFLQAVPNFKEEPYDLGSYGEIVHFRGGRSDREDQFEAGFDFAPRYQKGVASEIEDFHFQMTFEQGRTAPVLLKRRLAQGSTWIEEQQDERRVRFCTRGGRTGEWKTPEYFDRGDLDDSEERNRLAPLTFLFRSLMWKLEESSSKSGNASESIAEEDAKELYLLAREFERRHRYLLVGSRPYASAPVRSKPRRIYEASPQRQDPEGEYIPMRLAGLHFRGGKEWEYVKNALEDFGRSSGLFDEISVSPLIKKESGPFQLQIRKFGSRSKGPQRNLIDVGYGVSQVLPVVMELLRRRTPPMFLMQQPEVHLHPRAQAALGSQFCRMAGPKRQLVVETHSDYLLDRVRMDIRDGKSNLKPEDVSILYFERKDLDVKIHSIGLDEEGNVLNAPPSYRKFFMEEVNRRLKL